MSENQRSNATRGRIPRLALMLVAAAGLLSVATLTSVPRLTRGDWLEDVRRRVSDPAGGTGTAAGKAEAAWAAGGVVAEGRLTAYPGAQVTVASEMTGRLVAVPVVEGQAVRRGDLLAEIAADDLRAALDEATSRLDECDADVRLREWKARRIAPLLGTEAASAQEGQESDRDLAVARARRALAAAAVQRVQAELAKSRIVAPIDGTVVVRAAHAGQMVQPLTPVVTVVDLTRTRVEAEVNEFDAGRVRLGAAAVVTAEGAGGARWDAEVEEIPDVIVSRELRPQDPGRPSDTGVLLAKLRVFAPTGLKLGQRVEIRIAPHPAGGQPPGSQ